MYAIRSYYDAGERTRPVVTRPHPLPVIHDDAFVGISRDVPQPHEFIDIVVATLDRVAAHHPVDLALAVILVDRRKNIADHVVAVSEEK